MLGEIPVGVVTAVIGAPFFLLLLRRARAGYEL
jgi:ABC-type Fe3+-siderophore transport system permease subunit